MNELERCNRVTKVYTDIVKRIEDVGGKLDMLPHKIDANPKCGSCGCHGGWLADHFKTDISKAGKCRDFGDGIKAMSSHLNFESDLTIVGYLSNVWHNENVCSLFFMTDEAFNNDGTTTFPDIANYMIEAFKRKAIQSGV